MRVVLNGSISMYRYCIEFLLETPLDAVVQCLFLLFGRHCKDSLITVLRFQFEVSVEPRENT